MVSTIALPAGIGTEYGAPYSPVLEAGGSLWIGSRFEIVRVDPRSKKLTTNNPTIASHATDLASGLGAMWAVDNGGILYRLDPHSAAVLKQTPIGQGSAAIPTAVAVAAGAVWVTDTSGNKIWRVDATGTPTGSIDVGHLPVSLAPAGGSVWVADQNDNTLAQIDPSKSTLVRMIPLPHTPVALCGDGNQLVVAVQ